MKILSLGDCNTLGVQNCEGNAYPEKFAKLLAADSCNCGFTMSTIREAKYFFRDFYDSDTNILTIQYGLVDSWKSFRFSPYVLYYPDNPFRKMARKMVKKYKKTCRNLGLNDRLGTLPVVPPEKFTASLREIIQMCRPDTKIILIETVPNLDESRNPAIQKYNALMKQVALSDERCSILEIYNDFDAKKDEFYIDPTHINEMGHECIAAKLFDLYNEDTK